MCADLWNQEILPVAHSTEEATMSQSGNGNYNRTATANRGELAAEAWHVPIEEKGARTQHARGSFECRELAVLLPIYIFALCLLGLSLLTFASTASADETTWTFNGPSWLTTHIAPPVEKHDRFESVDRLSDGRRVAVGTTPEAARIRPPETSGCAIRRVKF